MQKADFAVIKSSLNPEVVVPMWLPDGKRRNSEWVAPNPTRGDSEAGSFSINLKTGVWSDFATKDSGSDMISLYAYLHGMKQGEAARELSENNGITLNAVTRKAGVEAVAQKARAIDENRSVPVLPVPAHATEPTFYHEGLRAKPDTVWTYRDAAGNVLMYVCRFDPKNPGDRKQIRPYTWCDKRKDNAPAGWDWVGITGDTPRPLYGIERLAQHPNQDVIVVEGEKAADAAQAIVGTRAVVVTWLNGVPASDKVDVSPLAGRLVVLWPDFDAQVDKATGEVLQLEKQPGIIAMNNIANSLNGVAANTTMVGYVPGEFEPGWDLADGKADGWDAERMLGYLTSHEGATETIVAGGPSFDESSHHIAVIGTAPAATAPAKAYKLVDDLDALATGVFPDRSEKDRPLNTWQNLKEMLDVYGITARYNVVKKDVIVTIPGRSYDEDTAANCALAEINTLCARNGMPKADTDLHLKLIGDKNKFNPARELIESKPWDGVSRLDALYETLTLAPGFDRDFMKLLVRRWLLSAAAAVIKPNFRSKGVLVLQGGQSIGKTAWFMALVPEVNRDLLKVGALVDPANKDTISSAIGHWMVELGELDSTFRKADIARLKAFISQDIDQLRRPYDRLESTYKRRTVFFASVNPKNFLADDTGNVRWWTLPVIAVNFRHSIDMQQLWAEVAELVEGGEQWWLEPDEEARLEMSNREHEKVDPLEEKVLSRFDWSAANRVAALTPTDVLEQIGYLTPTKQQRDDMGTILRRLTGKESRKSCGRRVFDMPPMLRSGYRDEDDGLPI
jgi:predicted P-loop ATPase